jgi:hypothetical protein
MLWSRGAEISFSYRVAVAGSASQSMGIWGHAPQENYISLDRFWCILSILVYKSYYFFGTFFVSHFCWGKFNCDRLQTRAHLPSICFLVCIYWHYSEAALTIFIDSKFIIHAYTYMYYIAASQIM